MELKGFEIDFSFIHHQIAIEITNDLQNKELSLQCRQE